MQYLWQNDPKLPKNIKLNGLDRSVKWNWVERLLKNRIKRSPRHLVSEKLKLVVIAAYNGRWKFLAAETTQTK